MLILLFPLKMSLSPIELQSPMTSESGVNIKLFHLMINSDRKFYKYVNDQLTRMLVMQNLIDKYRI